MSLALHSKLNETLEMLTSHIDEGQQLDAFTLKRVVSGASKIPDEPYGVGSGPWSCTSTQ